MKTPALPLALLALAVLPGCKEYYTVDEACHPKDKLPGQAHLQSDVAVGAMNRVNCHRRLVKLSRGNIENLVQQTASDHVQYLLKNPDLEPFTNAALVSQIFAEETDKEGFTGATLEERVDQAGYSFYNPASWGYYQMLYLEELEGGADPDALEPGPDFIDTLMRDHDFRQMALQPSWVDGAYAYVDVDAQWFVDGGWADLFGELYVEPPSQARLHYFIVFHDLPHTERVPGPVTYPKDGQLDVPTYSWSVDQDDPNLKIVQIGYPITMLFGPVDPETTSSLDQNLYGIEVQAASVHGPNGPLATHVVQPGDAEVEVYPNGLFLRSQASVFTYEPLTPGTQYALFADVVTADGDYDVDIAFTTADADPGRDGDAAAQARSRVLGRPLWRSGVVAPATPSP